MSDRLLKRLVFPVLLRIHTSHVLLEDPLVNHILISLSQNHGDSNVATTRASIVNGWVLGRMATWVTSDTPTWRLLCFWFNRPIELVAAILGIADIFLIVVNHACFGRCWQQ